MSAFDLQGNLLPLTGTFPNLSQPAGMVFVPSNHLLYVANQMGPGINTITVYDVNGNQQTTTGTFPGVNYPVGMAYDPDNNVIYLSNAFGGSGAGSISGYN